MKRFIIGLNETAAFSGRSMIWDPKALGAVRARYLRCARATSVVEAAQGYRSCRDEQRSYRRGRLEGLGS